MSEKPVPQIGMRVRVRGWHKPNDFGTIVEVNPDSLRVVMDDYAYAWDSDAHTFPWPRCVPALPATETEPKP